MIVKYLINRPIAVISVFISVLAIGFYGWYKIPVSLLPKVDPPAISIEVKKAGYNASVMEHNVLSRIRQTVVGAYGLKNIESEATQGFGRINLTYAFGTDMDLAMIEINEKIDRVFNALPPELDRPVVKKKKPTDLPILRIHISSQILSLEELSDLAHFEFKKRLEQLPGISRIEMNGTVQRSLRLTPRSEKILAAGLNMDEISEQIQKANLPLGQILVKEGIYEYLIQIENLIRDKASLQALNIKTRHGTTIALKELFHIEESHLLPLNMHLFNDKRGIVMAIYQQPEADLQTLQTKLDQVVNTLKKDYPSLNITDSEDQIWLLNTNIEQLYLTSALAIFFAFIVFFISGKSTRLPLILGTVIPSSILIAVGTLWMMGFTLNIITLSGFILGIGLLVDNVIILIEEINQNRAAGLPVKEACIRSVQNIFPALLSSTLTTICVFIPLLALKGIASELFKEQAIALIVILGISLMLTFILIPTFYTLWIKREVADRKWIQKLQAWSHKKHPLIPVVIIVVLLIPGGIFLFQLPVEDLPQYDTSDVRVRIVWNEPLALEENERRVRTILSSVDEPFTSADLSLSGITKNEIAFFDEASLYIQSKSGNALELAKSLSQRVKSKFPNASVSYSRAPNALEMIFYDHRPYAEARIRKDDGNFFTKSDIAYLEEINDQKKLGLDLLEGYRIVPDKEKMERLGIDYPFFTTYLKNISDENVITSFTSLERAVPLVVRPVGKDHFILLDSSYHLLSNFYAIKDTSEIRTIYADLSGPYVPFQTSEPKEAKSFGEAMSEAKGWLYDLNGRFLSTKSNVKQLAFAGLLGVVLLYLILAAQFESFTLPLLIFSIAPLSFSGSIIGLYLSGSTINTMSIIGMVVMLGVIVNDSILKIDAINRNIKNGLTMKLAITKAKDERLKPILMTSLSTILALVPVVFSNGIASDLQRPLAVAIIGGLIVGTWSSIALLPGLYRLLKKNP